MNSKELAGFIQHIQVMNYLYDGMSVPSIIRQIFFVNGGGYVYHNDTIIGYIDNVEVDINEYNTNLNLISLWMQVEMKHQLSCKSYKVSVEQSAKILENMMNDVRTKKINEYTVDSFKWAGLLSEMCGSNFRVMNYYNKSIVTKLNSESPSWMIKICIAFLRTYLYHIVDFAETVERNDSMAKFANELNRLELL